MSTQGYFEIISSDKDTKVYILLLITLVQGTKFVEVKAFDSMGKAMTYKVNNLKKYDEILFFSTEME